MVAAYEVYFQKHLGSLEVPLEVLDVEYWILVSSHDLVERVVVTTRPPALRFWHHMERKWPWAVQVMPYSHLFHLLKRFFRLLELGGNLLAHTWSGSPVVGM